MYGDESAVSRDCRAHPVAVTRPSNERIYSLKAPTNRQLRYSRRICDTSASITSAKKKEKQVDQFAFSLAPPVMMVVPAEHAAAFFLARCRHPAPLCCSSSAALLFSFSFSFSCRWFCYGCWLLARPWAHFFAVFRLVLPRCSIPVDCILSLATHAQPASTHGTVAATSTAPPGEVIK